jgi:hypothetical protein
MLGNSCGYFCEGIVNGRDVCGMNVLMHAEAPFIAVACVSLLC